MGAEFETSHYTQVLRILLNLKTNFGKLEAKVTYHDPYYLGRHNQEYENSRKILQSIRIDPGRDEKKSERLFLLRRWGRQFLTDIMGSGKDSPATIRVKEAAATGAEILAVACPNCTKMFEDAIKAEGLNRLKVRDIAGLVRTLWITSFNLI